MPKIDLHLHTTFSDGSHSPAEVVHLAHVAGLTALAITDHDTVEGIPASLPAGNSLGIEIIPGIELSSRFEGCETHILGYFFDWENVTLLDRLNQQQANREQRNTRVVKNLNKLGLELSYKEVKTKAGSGSVAVSYTHLTLPTNREV